MEEPKKPKDNSHLFLAVFLILFGFVWILRLMGVHLDTLFHPVQVVFSRFGRVLFSWPMIVVAAGLVLLAGKRQAGWILIVVGGLFLLPRIFMIPDLSFSLLAPVILVIAGAALIMKRT